MKKVVLMYHSISEDNWIYSVGLEQFREHVELINTHADKVIVTFDDAYEDVFDPLMELDIQCPVVVFVPASHIGGEVDGRKVMSRIQLVNLKRRGIKIGLHGFSHKSITSLEHLESEIQKGRDVLGNLISEEFLFSFPNGVIPQGAEVLLRREGVKWAFSSDPGVWRGQYIVPRFVIRRQDPLKKLKNILRLEMRQIMSCKIERLSLCLLRSLVGEERYRRVKEYFVR